MGRGVLAALACAGAMACAGQASATVTLATMDASAQGTALWVPWSGSADLSGAPDAISVYGFGIEEFGWWPLDTTYFGAGDGSAQAGVVHVGQGLIGSIDVAAGVGAGADGQSDWEASAFAGASMVIHTDTPASIALHLTHLDAAAFSLTGATSHLLDFAGATPDVSQTYLLSAGDWTLDLRTHTLVVAGSGPDSASADAGGLLTFSITPLDGDVPVPEPATWALMIVGLALVGKRIQGIIRAVAEVPARRVA